MNTIYSLYKDDSPNCYLTTSLEQKISDNIIYKWLNLSHDASSSDLIEIYQHNIGLSELNLQREKEKRKKFESIGEWIKIDKEIVDDEFDEIIDFGEDYYVEAEPFDMAEAIKFHEALERAKRCRDPQDYPK